jgi:site-specific recombinase XerD
MSKKVSKLELKYLAYKKKSGVKVPANTITSWYENNASGSRRTAYIYLFHLDLYCRFRKLNPTQLIEEAKASKSYEKNVEEYINYLKAQNRAGKYINVALNGIKSWFLYNELEFRRRIKIRGLAATPTIENERPPSKKELHNILDHADIREKAVCSLIAFAGLRPELIGNLKIENLVEFDLAKKEFTNPVPAIWIQKDMVGNKAKVNFFTFLTKQGANYLAAYLKIRSRKEKLTPNSYVVTGKMNLKIGHDSVSNIIRNVFRKADFSFRPYVLRSYFDTAMESSPIKKSKQQFFMGHKGDIEAVYTTRKFLPPERIEELREEYKKVEPFLSTEITEGVAEDIEKRVKLDMLRRLAEYIGLSNLLDEQIPKMKLKTIDEEIEVIEKAVEKARKQGGSLSAIPRYERKIVAKKEEFLQALDDGWEVEHESPTLGIITMKRLRSIPRS